MASALPLVVVFTANSNTGESAIQHLLTKFAGQVRVRGVIRDLKEKDEDLEAQGVEFIQGDILKTQILGPCFEGANAAYFSVPTAKDRSKHGKAFIDACMRHGCQHAVIISVVGIESGATAYHREFKKIEEYAAQKSGQPVTVAIADRGHKKFGPIIIRSPPFYQNFYAVLANIADNILYYPLDDQSLTHTDFSDIGLAIATCLASPEQHVNQAYNIIGDAATGNMIAATVGMQAGLQCEYKHVSDETCQAAFEALGLQTWIANGNVEMLKFIREGGLKGYDKGDFEKLTGQQPIKFRNFVKNDLKPMLRS